MHSNKCCLICVVAADIAQTVQQCAECAKNSTAIEEPLMILQLNLILESSRQIK